MKTKLFLVILFLFTGVFSTMAQDPTAVKVEELSDRQIQTIINEVNARGLTIEQAAQMAKFQGASEEQIEEIKKRIEELETGVKLPDEKDETKKSTLKSKKEKSTEDLITEDEGKSKKEKVTISEKQKQIFGYQLFNSENLSFEPSVNIPVPQNYILGIDDEITISVWGNNQKTYQLKVLTNGAVNIPDIGLVYVSGMEYIKAKELIKRRLTAIYSNMGGANPSTYADVTVSNTRSIKVNVIGEAMIPGTYTLPSTSSAFNALYLSGGPNENGSFRNVQVIRDNKTVQTIDVYDFILNANTSSNIQLREQDIIYVPVYEKRVCASGEFKRKGLFELKENEKIADLMKYSGGFTEKAYKSQLSVTRYTEKEKKVLDISNSIFDSFVCNNGDSIVASEIIDRYENRVSISGAVFRPGTYELTEGLTLSGLIKKAQGVKESSFNRGMILRLKEDLTPMSLSFELDKVLKGEGDIELKREDQVVIQDIFKMKEKMTVQIFGEVQRPGEYEYAENMTLKDLIFKSGGFSESASESFIELARRHSYEESTQVADELVKLYQFNIDRELKIDAESDKFILKPFDYIYVRSAPSYHKQRTVYITGEVRYPGPYSIGSKNERVSDLIKRAGGLMPNAFVKGANMKRANKQAEQNIDVLEAAIEDSMLTKVETQLKNTQLELRLESILKNPGTEFDYLLKDGDQINIPEFSQEVRISGEIRNPIGLAYESGRPLKYYIERNGGFGEKADKSKVFVIYCDGTTKVTRNFLGPVYPPIEPGCQIVIPKKEEKARIDDTGKWLGIASTLATVLLAINSFLQP
jgi:protein involved in polysaccharide export with SLBB domain